MPKGRIYWKWSRQTFLSIKPNFPYIFSCQQQRQCPKPWQAHAQRWEGTSRQWNEKSFLKCLQITNGSVFLFSLHSKPSSRLGRFFYGAVFHSTPLHSAPGPPRYTAHQLQHDRSHMHELLFKTNTVFPEKKKKFHWWRWMNEKTGESLNDLLP